MVKVRVRSREELAKIEEKLCEAVLETLDAAKRDPGWDQARAKALKRHLYAMTERVLGSVRANVLCEGDGAEAGARKVSESEIADPELDALEAEVAELSARVAEQRATVPGEVAKNYAERLMELRPVESAEGEDDDAGSSGAEARVDGEAMEALRKELDANLAQMPELQARLQEALSKLGRLMGELDLQRQRAPPGTIERAINAPAGGDTPATGELAPGGDVATRRRLAHELQPIPIT